MHKNRWPRNEPSSEVRFTITIAIVAALCGFHPLGAGQGIVTVNQHKTLDPSGTCVPTHSCNPTADPPFAAISNSTTNLVDAFSYHVDDNSGVINDGRFCQATCVYEYGNRPKIISTDSGAATVGAVSDWIDFICADAATSGRQGQLHFEHWLTALTNQGTGNPTSNPPVDAECFGGYSTWRLAAKDAADEFNDRSVNCIPDFVPNGRLQRGNDATPTGGLTKFYWRNQRTQPTLSPVNLLGFGFMGALAMGDRLDHEAFLESVRERRANFLRVWTIEQWTGDEDTSHASCNSLPDEQPEGPTPFVGSLAADNFDIDSMNPKFFRTLRSFVQNAADRGIVVQLSIFDKHGLVDPPTSCSEGRFEFSPYNNQRNIPEIDYIDAGWSGCACAAAGIGELEPDPFSIGKGCVPPDEFILRSELVQQNDALIRRIAQEVGGIGNVMFEVVNEAIAGEDWPGLNSGWQVDIAEKVRLQLPVRVARDAFNGATSGSLAGRTPDWRSGTTGSWTTNGNVRLKGAAAPESLLVMGYATSTGGSTTEMEASLPISAPNWTEASVRARLDSDSDLNTFQLGFEDSTGNRTYLQYGDGQAPGSFSPDTFCPCLTLWHDAAGVTEPVRIGGIAEIGSGWGKHFRLNLRKPEGAGNGTASILIEDFEEDLFENVPMAILNPTKAYFHVVGPTPIPVDGANVDNFEAAIFCNSNSTCSASE